MTRRLKASPAPAAKEAQQEAELEELRAVMAVYEKRLAEAHAMAAVAEARLALTSRALRIEQAKADALVHDRAEAET